LIGFREHEVFQIYQAIREDKNEDLLRKLIEEDTLTLDSRNKEGMGPLLLAVDCEFSHDTLKFLIVKGCNVNAQDDQGRTALHYACDL